MLVKFEQNRMVKTTRNFDFLTKNSFFITIFNRVDAIFNRSRFCS